MDFGVVFQCDPPASAVVDLAVKAEEAGFSHVWTFDSHLLWQEPFVIYSQILAATDRVIVGPMVTNPGTRDWTVIASQFATLNEMYGNRTVCGIGRGDSALRTLGKQPGTIAEMKECVEVVRSLARGETVEYRGQQLKLAWVQDGALELWVAAYGPKALAASITASPLWIAAGLAAFILVWQGLHLEDNARTLVAHAIAQEQVASPAGAN